MNKKRVLVAMSGGVDSSTAAHLLKSRGYEVIGINMRLWEEGGRCCNLSDTEDARRVARKLSIPLYVLNLKKEFEKEVVEYFCWEYLNGRTPNPCIVCNEKIKFGILLKKAKEFGVFFIATGHYAKVEFNPSTKRYCLKKGKDPKKEQSYFLFSLSQRQLSHTIFPLSDLTKEEVRQIAAENNLPVHEKKESQEVCFISQKNYNEFLKNFFEKKGISPFSEGFIVDREGKIVGRHKGIHLFTIGQRKGLAGGREEPFYVVDIDKKKNIITIGTREDVYTHSMQVSKVNWVSIQEPEKPFYARVKIRSQHPESLAYIYKVTEGKWRVDFLHPQWAITPGQAAVFYREDTVLGGGWIEKVIR